MTTPHRSTPPRTVRPSRRSPEWTDLALQLSGFYSHVWGFVVLAFGCLVALLAAAFLTWCVVNVLGILPGVARALVRLGVLLWDVPWIYKVIAPFTLFYVFSLLWIEFVKGESRSEDPPIRGRHVVSGQDARRRAAALVDGPSSRSHRP